MNPTYSDVAAGLDTDGSLRDFYILDASEGAWDKFLAVVPTLSDRITFTHGSKEIELPRSFRQIAPLQDTDPTTLSIDVAGGAVNCHFITSEVIELDFAPQDFQSAEKWDELTAMFSAIVCAVWRPGIVTHENSPKNIIAEINMETVEPASAGNMLL